MEEVGKVKFNFKRKREIFFPSLLFKFSNLSSQLTTSIMSIAQMRDDNNRIWLLKKKVGGPKRNKNTLNGLFFFCTRCASWPNVQLLSLYCLLIKY